MANGHEQDDGQDDQDVRHRPGREQGGERQAAGRYAWCLRAAHLPLLSGMRV